MAGYKSISLNQPFSKNKVIRIKTQRQMPLRLPDKLPAIDILKGENIFVIDETRGLSQDIRPLKIVILNLMPIKLSLIHI